MTIENYFLPCLYHLGLSESLISLDSVNFCMSQSPQYEESERPCVLTDRPRVTQAGAIRALYGKTRACTA